MRLFKVYVQKWYFVIFDGILLIKVGCKVKVNIKEWVKVFCFFQWEIFESCFGRGVGLEWCKGLGIMM